MFAIAHFRFNLSCQKKEPLIPWCWMPLSHPSNRKGNKEVAGRRHHLREQQRRSGRSKARERQFNLKVVEMGFTGLIGIDAHIVHAVTPILFPFRNALSHFKDRDSVARSYLPTGPCY